jgi:tetratricopeptide (TPR) repeat protein
VPKSNRAGGAIGAPPFRGRGSFVFRRGTLLAGAAIALAALAAYSDSFSGPFVLDDAAAISANPTIGHLWNAFSPPAKGPVSGRPLLNFTFAANYTLGGYRVWGYHALNLLVHVLAGLTLFGIVRRTLSKPALAGRYGHDALLLALVVAVIWTVHPVQTEAVTYISERAESLMGLFYLLTLYLFVRGMDSGRPAPWRVLSVLACILGALTKETIATAPLLVLLYDRTFGAGSFRGALRARWRYYLGLAASWPLLAWLSMGLAKRGIGFGYGVTWWDYALTSCRSVAIYLKLAVWPHPLVFDYGADIVRNPIAIAPYAAILAAFIALTAVALRRWPAFGFACASFLLILLPTTSVVPLALLPVAEHRMYLSLAAVAGAAVLGLYACMGRWSLIPLAAVAIALGTLTFQRNRDYGSAVAIWRDTAAKRPGNARAHNGYGFVLSGIPGSRDQAISEYEAALRIDPGLAEAHNNLGIALAGIPGRLPEAVDQYRAAIRINPGFAQAHNDLGAALAGVPGREREAIEEYEAALRIDPDYAEAHNNLGIALAATPALLPDAIAHFRAALRVNPGYVEAHENLGMALAGIPGRLPEAISEYEEALRIRPGDAQAHNNLGIALANSPGRLPEAVAQFEEALRILPGYADARGNLEIARKLLARSKEGGQ